MYIFDQPLKIFDFDRENFQFLHAAKLNFASYFKKAIEKFVFGALKIQRILEWLTANDLKARRTVFE